VLFFVTKNIIKFKNDKIKIKYDSMVVNDSNNFFGREAKRWHKIFKQLDPTTLAKESPKNKKKYVRLSFRNKQKSIKRKLKYLYGEEKGQYLFERIEAKMKAFVSKKPRKIKYRDAHFNPLDRFTHKDCLLITYPDLIREEGEKPLQTLNHFMKHHVKDSINSLHILPFYPYSSDRGFSVVNYKKVKKEFGTWKHIRKLSEDYKLMFDGVFNHISSKSRWFKQFLRKNELYDNHFISFDSKDAIPKDQLSKIVRPRTNPLLSKYTIKKENFYVWTTFSEDQVDLNFKEARIMLRIVDVIFRYIRNGASMIRLDAVNYLWKELGTSCVHLKQTHVIIQLFRDILDIVSPSVSLITETNVPHAKNISYFGNGKNEAQMVYNFALPPLVLYTFYKENTKYISRWADRLEKVSEYCTYFNFLASHDGIGLMPVTRVLPKRQVNFMIKKAKEHGSLISYKSDGKGERIPYELNVTWWSAINKADDKVSEELQLQKYLASVSIALVLKGVPGIYLHSLLGSKNDMRSVSKSNHNRDINRRNLSAQGLKKILSEDTIYKKVFESYTELVKIRSNNKAFHPIAEQKIIAQNDKVFSILRTSIDKKEKILVLVNVTSQEQEFVINLKDLDIHKKSLYDLISKKNLFLHTDKVLINEVEVKLEPYEMMWLRSSE
jgi:glycosidase